MGLSLLLTIRKELPAKFCLDISERDSPHGSKAGDDEVHRSKSSDSIVGCPFSIPSIYIGREDGFHSRSIPL